MFFCFFNHLANKMTTSTAVGSDCWKVVAWFQKSWGPASVHRFSSSWISAGNRSEILLYTAFRVLPFLWLNANFILFIACNLSLWHVGDPSLCPLYIFGIIIVNAWYVFLFPKENGHLDIGKVIITIWWWQVQIPPFLNLVSQNVLLALKIKEWYVCRDIKILVCCYIHFSKVLVIAGLGRVRLLQPDWIAQIDKLASPLTGTGTAFGLSC